MNKNFEHRPFHTTKEEIAKITPSQADKSSPCYELAFNDTQFLLREELRPVRLQLELLKTELVLQDHKIKETVVVFGSARIPEIADAQASLAAAQKKLAEHPNDAELKKEVLCCENVLANSLVLEETVKFAEMVSQYQGRDFYVVTGGGPSFMQAANKGAYNAGKPSISLGVLLPHEQVPNDFVTPELTFQFHYFAIRKMHFLMRAKALVAFPGGFGTLDELFECLTLLQTKKIEPLPLVLFRRAFWDKIVNFEELAMQGTISHKDLDLIHFAETANEAWDIIKSFYKLS